MRHARIPLPAAPAEDMLAAVQNGLASIAAGIDARFLFAATTLATAVETIERLTASLDQVLHALDARSAGAAAATLRDSAARLNALPTLQAERVNDVETVRKATTDLYTHVTGIHEMLRMLRVRAANLRITTTGSDAFTAFVDDMCERFDAGEEHLEGFMAPLRELAAGAATVQRAARLLADECAKLIPLVPDRLAADAQALQAHQAGIAESATAVAEIARGVRDRVAVVLGTLQIGDITRQRVEHMVAALQLIGGRGARRSWPVASHLLRLIAAQLVDVAEDFERETGLLLAALGELAPDAERLLALTRDGAPEDEGRSFLHRLERGITELDGLTSQLRSANERALTMSAVIADTMDQLTHRLDAVRAVRADVVHIAVNAMLRAQHMGAAGREAGAITEEIGTCADQLDRTVGVVAAAIFTLDAVSRAIRNRRAYEAQLDLGLKLGRSLALIREGCRRTEQAMGEGRFDSHELVEALVDAGERLGHELEIGGTIRRFALELRAMAGEPVAIGSADDAALRELLVQVGALYTMAGEREVHRDYLLPGMEWKVTEVAAGEEEAFDDGLF